MLGYYFELAIRSLKANAVLTLLMIAAVGVGIGASMTMLATLRAMSGDPIPDKSSQLFVPQIDVWGPDSRRQDPSDRLPDQLTYRDAMAFMRVHRGIRRTAMYSIGMDVDPGSGRPFQASGRAAYADFFTMFEVPFREGVPWSAADDEGRANVVALSAKLADRVFPGANPLGRTLNLDGREYRVVGVLKPWNPMPKFYDATSGGFANAEDFYVPFTNAIEHQNESYGNQNCTALPPAGWDGLLASDCIWLQFWVELHDVGDWMVQQRVVPEQVRVNTLIGLGFLVVCLINAGGLMLAKFGSRAGELGVRRALGGSRTDIFLQCLVETAVIGCVGGLLGTVLTALGLAIDRALLAPGAKNVQLDSLTSIDAGMFAIILAVAIVSTVGVGLFPAWRASRLQPAWQLKAQ